MLLKTGMKLPNGTILQYTKKQFGPESTVGKLEISDGGTRWFISPNNSGWRIRPNSQHDWDKYELGSEGDYTLAKMHENKNKSALDLLKEYRDIVESNILFPSKPIDQQTYDEKHAYANGKKNGGLDFRMGTKSRMAFATGENEGSYYNSTYSRGYRDGWNQAVHDREQGTNEFGIDEGRIHEPSFTLLDRSGLDEFMTKRGFVRVKDPRETESVTYKSSALDLSVMIDHDDDFWTIEHVGVDEVLADGRGERALKSKIIKMIRDVKNPREDKVKSGKFNTCDECDGVGCPVCYFTGKYAVGMNKDHYL